MEVPSDLTGKDVKVATYILEQLGFTVKTTLEYRDDMEKDLVISVPEAGTTKDYGSEIELIVSAKENGSEEPDTPATPVYKYVGIIQEIPEGAKWYTYVLYDATNGVLAKSTDMIAISGSGITITVEDLSTDSGHIVVTWYGDADEDGTPDATSIGEYTGETVSFEPTSEPGTTDTPEA